MTDKNIPIEEYNILLCGGARVGKSTLINALCGQNLAATSASLHSCTQEQTRYTLNGEHDGITYAIHFWDSPGIESWAEYDVREYISQLIDDTDPLCMIYCASPGSFTRLDQLDWILDTCINSNIFCAFVCTNMWASSKRYVVKEEFLRLLRKRCSEDEVDDGERDGIVRFGKQGLVALVNSTRYVDKELGVNKREQGVNELIVAIAEGLDAEKLLGWLYTIAKNESVWASMADKLNSIFHRTYNSVWDVIGHLKNLVNRPDRPPRRPRPIKNREKMAKDKRPSTFNDNKQQTYASNSVQSAKKVYKNFCGLWDYNTS